MGYKIKIQFKEDTDIRLIEYLNRRHTPDAKLNNSTYIEQSFWIILKAMSVYKILPVYPLMLLGLSLEELVKWELATPQYPESYMFDCEFYSNIPKTQVVIYVEKLKLIDFIESVTIYENY